MTLGPPPGQLSSSVEAPAFPSRPDNRATRRAAEGMGGAGPPGARRRARPLRREHAEDGEPQTFPEASTVPRSAQGGGERGSGCSRRYGAFSRHRGCNLARRPSLCRLAGRFQVVRRPLPSGEIATPVLLLRYLIVL